LKAIDVMAAPGAAAAVALGDSITDGVCATVDGHDTWPEWLALRLDLEGRRRIAILNEGINGNTLTRFSTEPPFPVGMTSIPVVERLDRDLLSHSGVKYLLLFIGTNDIRRGPPASQVIEGMDSVIKRARERGLRVYGATIVPRHIARLGTPGNPGWTAEASKLRQEVNAWMRSKKARFDAILDFDQVVRDPANHDLILPPHNCDDIHLSPRGYFEVAKSVRLDLFNTPASRR
jgi:lysophospholipase L1-like esterase